MKYIVKVTEHNEAWREFEAESEDEAIEIAQERYDMDSMHFMKNGEFMVDFDIERADNGSDTI